MPKALFVATIAGTHRSFLLPLALHFRKLGWRIDAAAAGISNIPECRMAYDNVYEMNWSRNPLNPRGLFFSAQVLHSLVEKESYDLVHVHTPVAAFTARFTLRHLRERQGLSVVYTAHGFHFHPEGNPFSNVAFLVMEKLAGYWTDRLIVINLHDKVTATKFRIVDRKKIVYMPGIGVDRKTYNPDNVSADDIATVRKEIGIDNSTPLFLMIADFMPGKRHKDVINAFRAIKRDARLAFAGSGERSETLREIAKEAGVESRVHFLGLRKDISALIRSSVATIMPSVREGLSRSVLESLCLEVPVIGADVRGIRDLLELGGGLLVPTRTPDALRRAMDWILDHPEEARAMGREGRKNTEKYDLANILRLHEDLYSDMILRK